MAMMSGALYDALREAGSSNEKARAAAEEVADIRTEFAKIEGEFKAVRAQFETLKWMLGVNMTLTTLFGGGSFAVLWRLASH